MANGMNQIMLMATIKINQQINDNYGIKWANEAMRKLASKYDTAGKLCDEPYTATVEAYTPHVLPSDCTIVKRVTDGDGVPIKDYRIDLRNRIELSTAGTISIEYYVPHVVIERLTDDPSINAQYWDALSAYIALQHLKSVGAEAEYQQELKAEFEELADSADIFLKRRKRPTFIPARRWR